MHDHLKWGLLLSASAFALVLSASPMLYALQPASYALLITAEGLLRIPYEAREDFLHRVLLAFDGRVAGGDHMQRT